MKQIIRNSEIEKTQLFKLLRGYNQPRIEKPTNKIQVIDYEENLCGFCYYYYTVFNNYQIIIIESKVENLDFIYNFKLFVDCVFDVLQITHFESIKIFALHKDTIYQYCSNQLINLDSVQYETSFKLKQIIVNLNKDSDYYRDNIISFLQKTRKHNSRKLRIK